MTVDQQKSVERQFHGRCQSIGIDALDAKQTRSKKYLDAQADFFCGAMAGAIALTGDNASLPPFWVISIGSGRAILIERQRLEVSNGNA